jgi:hypothetical protein
MGTEREAFRGTARREKPVLEFSGLPLKGAVAVVPNTRLDGRVGFQVEASWTGPGLPELGKTRGPVDVTDVYWTPDLEFARALAIAAVDELRAARAPDLRSLRYRFLPPAP